MAYIGVMRRPRLTKSPIPFKCFTCAIFSTFFLLEFLLATSPGIELRQVTNIIVNPWDP